LPRGVQVAGVAWWEAMRIVARVGDLVQRAGDDRTGLGPNEERGLAGTQR
jgi:hypothetical protein